MTIYKLFPFSLLYKVLIFKIIQESEKIAWLLFSSVIYEDVCAMGGGGGAYTLAAVLTCNHTLMKWEWNEISVYTAQKIYCAVHCEFLKAAICRVIAVLKIIHLHSRSEVISEGILDYSRS